MFIKQEIKQEQSYMEDSVVIPDVRYNSGNI